MQSIKQTFSPEASKGVEFNLGTGPYRIEIAMADLPEDYVKTIPELKPYVGIWLWAKDSKGEWCPSRNDEPWGPSAIRGMGYEVLKDTTVDTRLGAGLHRFEVTSNVDVTVTLTRLFE